MTELTGELRELKDEIKALRESLDDFKEYSKSTIHLKALTYMFLLIFCLVGSVKITEETVKKLPEIVESLQAIK